MSPSDQVTAATLRNLLPMRWTSPGPGRWIACAAGWQWDLRWRPTAHVWRVTVTYRRGAHVVDTHGHSADVAITRARVRLRAAFETAGAAGTTP